MNTIKCILSSPLCKRKLICLSLWIAFWFLCAYLAWTWEPDYWWSATMWMIVFNRFLIWWVVLILWAFTIHPLWFRILPFLRWLIWWAIVSLDLAIWSLTSWLENAYGIFWLIIVTWSIYWMIIDIVATRFAWEWDGLLKAVCNSKKGGKR